MRPDIWDLFHSHLISPRRLVRRNGYSILPTTCTRSRIHIQRALSAFTCHISRALLFRTAQGLHTCEQKLDTDSVH